MRSTASMAALRKPWVGLVLFGSSLVLGASLGRYWETVTILMIGLFFFLTWSMTGEAQRAAIAVMLMSPFLSVATIIRPEQYNYLAYSAILAFVVGVVTLLKNPRRLGIMIVFLVWFTLSALYSTWMIGPAPIYTFLVSPLGMIGMYSIAVGADGFTRKGFVRGLILTASVQALLGIAQTLGGLPPFSIWGGQVFSEPRNYLALLIPGISAQVRMATGTFSHFNGLGSMLALVVPLSLSSWLQRRTIGAGVVFVVIVTGLICTFSRGALLGGIIGCTIVFTRHEASIERTTRRVFLVLVSILVAVLSFSAVREYVAATGNFGSRLMAWQLALSSVISNPVALLFGVGFSYFASGYLQDHAAISRLHSAPVQILSEMGLFAAIALLCSLVPPLRTGVRSASIETNTLAASCIAFLTHQAFDNALFGYPGLLFIGVFGCVVAAVTKDQESRQSDA